MKKLSEKSVMHIMLLIVLAFFTIAAVAIKLAHGDETIHPTIPGTNVRDWSKPSIVIKQNGDGYQTLPGSNVRDYSKGGFKIERPLKYKRRINQPVQQGSRLLYVWPAQDGD